MMADVSHETSVRLEIYADLIRRWNPRINLVAPRTLDELWQRHFADSAQIADMAPAARTWADLGSGGGFPGAVVAIIAAERRPDLCVTLVESDQRKAAFLRAVARETGAGFQVIADRAENLKGATFDVVSARALAPLENLIGLAAPLLAPGGTCVFLKGAKAQIELDAALETWSFRWKTHPSKTAADAVILELGDIERA